MRRILVAIIVMGLLTIVTGLLLSATSDESNDQELEDDVKKSKYIIDDPLPIEYLNDSCLGARLGNIYVATKERMQYDMSGIILYTYNQAGKYKTFMYAGQCGVNEYGLFYACAAINSNGDTSPCGYESTFSSIEILLTCKDIPEVKQYISKNPIVNNANMLFCDKEGGNLKIQSLCKKTIITQNNNSFESITNYPFVINDDFKPRNRNLHINGLNRELFLSKYRGDSIVDVLALVESENISQIKTNNIAKYYTISAMVVDGNNVYIYYGCPMYNRYRVFNLEVK